MPAAFWWYLGTTLIGWLCFPLTQKIFRNLPGKGFTFSRIIGLLLWGFFHWILVSLGILRNTVIGQTIVLLLLVIASLFVAYKSGFKLICQWLRSNWRLVLGVELVFLVSFSAFAIFRAASPAIIGTEKPMELAFLNGILRSETFPPQDPWLSGYSISYYYFGYVMVAMLARLTGVPAAIAYNLAQALWFALIAAGAYGLMADLLAQREKKLISPTILRWAVLAPLLILLIGNGYGFLDSLHARGLFSTQVASSSAPGFWHWLDLQGLTGSPDEPLTYVPRADGAVAWWQASRVIQDVDYSGAGVEVIDEFPNFAFVLGDLHPHLLALPFVLLSIGLAFNFLLAPQKKFKVFKRRCLQFQPGKFVLDAALIGSLAFLNTWDWPIYAALYAAVFLIRRIRESGWKGIRLVEFLVFAMGMAGIGWLCYLPFFLNFASQAGGILPSVIYFTRGVDFWVMFGPLLIPVFGFLIWWNIRETKGKQLRTAFWITALVLVALTVLSGLLAVVASGLGDLGNLFMANLGAAGESIWRVLWEAFHRRLAQPGTWLTLGGLLILGVAVLIKVAKRESDQTSENLVDGFTVLLILLGGLLTLFPEFIYLLDGFGTRMNTIFKFYFQAWLLWSLAGAYGIAVLWQSYQSKLDNRDRLWLLVLTVLSVWIILLTAFAPMSVVSDTSQVRFGIYLLDWLWVVWGMLGVLGLVWMGIRRQWGGLGLILAILGLTVGLIYPAQAIPDRANGFRFVDDWTHDGSAVYQQTDPDLMAAVDWLQAAEEGVLAEAVGPDYSSYGRVSMLTGMQSVLGWRYHEVQWRGGSEEIGSRQEDLMILYETEDWESAKAVIGMYNIRYIYLGNLERAAYDVQEEKFTQNLALVFEQGTVKIFQVISD